MKRYDPRMALEKTDIYHSHLGPVNTLVIAPHATMSDERHPDADWKTGRLAIDLSLSTGCSYLLSVQPRNRDFGGSHDFNEIYVTDVTEKKRFRQKAVEMADGLLRSHDTVYVLNIHRMGRKKGGVERLSAMDLGTGGRLIGLRDNKLDGLCLSYGHMLDDGVTMNRYFSASSMGNPIWWFDEGTEAIQLEIREDYYEQKCDQTKDYLQRIIEELAK